LLFITLKNLIFFLRLKQVNIKLNHQFLNEDLIEVDIDDYKYFFEDFLTIFQACLEKNLFLPRFCYHVKLKIAGNCRICIVEELDVSKLLVSCVSSLTEDMILYTQTVGVKKAREHILEFLLINHPLDCPICDQGGECDLQDQTMAFGLDRGRFNEKIKRSFIAKNYSPFIKFLLNRCIQCTRCTRFISDAVNDFSISILGRGQNSEISSYSETLIRSELSGNIIDLCPVGALTSKPYSFIYRY
jgi:NADH dehydrogenase/NADH:ubiquinone oxidoreductase subunit G